MSIDRNYIDAVADIVRDNLSLSVPITLEALCNAISEKLQAKCIQKAQDELEVDAQIVTLDERKFEIHYLADRPHTRILFSISHELGHLFLHLLKKGGKLETGAICQRDMSQTKQELEANEFAAVLLMPEDEFIDKCLTYMKDNKVNVTKVADCFGVSVQAATVRGNVLGLW